MGINFQIQGSTQHMIMKYGQLVLAQTLSIHTGGQFRRIIKDIHVALEQSLVCQDTDLLDELLVRKTVWPQRLQ